LLIKEINSDRYQMWDFEGCNNPGFRGLNGSYQYIKDSCEKSLKRLKVEQIDLYFVPYSPLGRGFLTGKIQSKEELSKGDFRASSPRFQNENFEVNKNIVAKLDHIAKLKNCTLAQLSLAWMASKYANLVPIPGTKKVRYLQENAQSLDVNLTKPELETIDQTIFPDEIQGDRYPSELKKIYNPIFPSF